MEGNTKKKKRGLVIGIVAVVLVAAAVAFVFTGPMIVNAAMRSFASPAEYYRYIEKKAAKEKISDFGDWYEEQQEKYSGKDNVKEEAEIVFEIGDGLREILASMTVADVPAVDAVSFWYEGVSEADGSKGAVEAVFRVDETEVLHGDLVYDAEKEAMYVKVPELGDGYVGIKVLDVLGGIDLETEDSEAKLKKFFEVLPKKKQAEKILERYVELALECIENAEVGSATVEAGDVKSEYTEIVVTLDAETVQNIAEAVLVELQSDEDVEKLVKEICLANGSTDANASYEAFLNGAETLLSQVMYIEDAKENLVMTVWVDHKGKIAGRKFVIAEDAELFYAVAVDGKEIGCEASIKVNGIKISLEGEGARKREMFSGEFKLRAAGFGLAEFEVTDFDLRQFRKGYINGTVKISPAGIVRSLLRNITVNGDITLEDATILLSVANDKKQTSFSLALENDEVPFAGFSATMKTGKGKKIELPKEKDVTMFSSGEAFDAWFENADSQTIYDNLTQAGVSKEWLEELFGK